MEFLLIRHAEPEWVKDGLGVSDPPLTRRGLRQAERLAERLGEERFDEVWVSPMVRAQQTAAPLVDALGVTPKTLEWLREAAPPPLDGLPIEGLKDLFTGTRRRPVAAWWRGLPGGEDLREFVARVTGGLDAEMTARGARYQPEDEPPLWYDVPRDLRIAVVSHAGTSGALLSHLMHLPQVPWAWERFHLAHASIAETRTVAVADGVIFSLRSFGDVEHHPHEERTR